MEAAATRPITNPRPEILTEQFLSALRAAGVTEAFLFGSVACGEERSDSDLDLLVTFDREVFLFDRMDIADQLSNLAGRKIDLLTKIHPFFEPYIRPTLVPIPL
ncbi:MAG: nucleotidyltransferase domain-containing protein [Thermomicrobiales bacterium]|nr:nucleotidyltransferase domain-containing protein [Thermomicrobiales bacterium]MCO5221495.1 nucleotidyltransferase domain-containing protein [Thermomicrobiales bacterium]